MTTNAPHSLVSVISSTILDRRRNWYVFRAFNLYRLVLVTILLGVFLLHDQNQVFGGENPDLFLAVVVGYAFIILLSIAGSIWRRPSFRIQTHTQTVIDIIALSVLAMASGGLSSNINVLLLIAIAAGGLLLPLASALGMAVLAFLTQAGIELYQLWQPFQNSHKADHFTIDYLGQFFSYLYGNHQDLYQLGILGIALVVAALLTATLAERARRSEQLAGQRSQELLELAQLNQAIVQYLQSGIIVVDRYSRIRLMNETARELLNYYAPSDEVPLSEVSAVLSQRLATWLSISMHNPKPFRQAEHLPDVTPTFNYLGDRKKSGDMLILLEDSAQAAQRLQQIKLAALGRLTASIAHEIRNPLASISHAAQLLKESSTASPSDKRLGQIIHDNAKRASTIIANVLDLSRRDRAKPEEFMLKPWLEKFCQEFLGGQNEASLKIELRVQPAELVVRFDTGHLQQVLWNLFTNAHMHGTTPGETPKVRVSATVDQNRSRPILDIIDFGPGIPDAESKRIFEPFFTTKTQGTGLGLYISREICEANRGQLQYIRTDENGSCFRITFPAIRQTEKPAMAANTGKVA